MGNHVGCLAAAGARIDSVVHDFRLVVGKDRCRCCDAHRPARYNQPKGTTDILNKGVTLAMADARKPRG